MRRVPDRGGVLKPDPHPAQRDEDEQALAAFGHLLALPTQRDVRAPEQVQDSRRGGSGLRASKAVGLVAIAFAPQIG
jgi:hypothetical protein